MTSRQGSHQGLAGPSLRAVAEAVHPGMSSAVALTSVLLELQRIMVRCSERVISEPVSSESGSEARVKALHDLRVAVRRSRSALARLKRVLVGEQLQTFKSELRWIGKVTGPSRDLDVFLSRLDGYEESLRAAELGSLEELRALAETQRRSRRERMLQELDSRRFRDLLGDWREYLGSDAPRLGKHGPRPVLGVVSKVILRTHQGMVRSIGGLELAAADQGRPEGHEVEIDAEALHGLRIKAKQLRYMLELFRGLYSPSQLASLISQLKGLQDVLGTHQDLVVQQDLLAGLRQRPPGLAEAEAWQSPVVIDKLLEQLTSRQRALGLEAVSACKGFVATEQVWCYHELFRLSG